MFERFTRQARDVVVRARQEASQLGHPQVGTEHLLLALLSPDAGVPHAVLRRAGVEPARVRADVERLVGAPRRILSAEDAAALSTVGIDLDAVLARLEESFGPEALHRACPPPRRRLPWRRRPSRERFAPRAKKVLELSLREALRLGHDHLGSEHILLGLLREGSGLAAQILTKAGIDLDDLRRETLLALDRAA